MFERLIESRFKALGYETALTAEGPDGGVDLLVYHWDRLSVPCYVVQCKAWAGNVNNKAVQEAVTARVITKADEAVLITTSPLTSEASGLANRAGVRVIMLSATGDGDLAGVPPASQHLLHTRAVSAAESQSAWRLLVGIVASKIRALGYDVATRDDDPGQDADCLAHLPGQRNRPCYAVCCTPRTLGEAITAKVTCGADEGVLIVTSSLSSEDEKVAQDASICVIELGEDGSGDLPILAAIEYVRRNELGAAREEAAVASTEKFLPRRRRVRQKPLVSAPVLIAAGLVALIGLVILLHDHGTGTTISPDGGVTPGRAHLPSAVPEPPPPGSVHQVGLSPSSITVAWSPVPGATRYVIYGSGSSGAALGSTTQTEYTVGNVRADYVGTYSVSAENGGGASRAVPVSVRTDMSWQAIESEYGASIVRVSTYTTVLGAMGPVSGGTGWYAHSAQDGCGVVTAWHVVRNRYYFIDISPGTSPKMTAVTHAKVLKSSASPDLALLQRDDRICGTTLPIAAAGEVKVGMAVAVLGLPGLEQVTLTQGTVTQVAATVAVKGIGTQVGAFWFNAGSVPGNSGSPVFDHFGRVVGVVECGEPTNGNTGCAIGTANLRGFLGL